MAAACRGPKRCPYQWGVPLVPIALALGVIVTTGLWFGYMTKALAATKEAAYLMLMPTPPAFIALPGVFVATLVAAILIPLLAVAAAALRAARRPQGRPYLAASGAANGLALALAFWLAVTFGITVLWAGAMLVSDKSTADAAVTLRSVDPQVQRLIYQASGGAINGTESGFIVSVGEGKGPRRDVDIGKSTCSLFCFVFARAMMSDSMDCYCDVPIMAKIHDITKAALKQQLVPAALCNAVALLCALGLLLCGGAQFGSADSARRGAAAAARAKEAGLGGAGYKNYVDGAVDVHSASSGEHA